MTCVGKNCNVLYHQITAPANVTVTFSYARSILALIAHTRHNPTVTLAAEKIAEKAKSLWPPVVDKTCEKGCACVADTTKPPSMVVTVTKTITIDDYYVDDVGLGGCYWDFSGQVDLTTTVWAGVCDHDEQQEHASALPPKTGESHTETHLA